MTEEPRYCFVVCETQAGFETKLNEYAEHGWRVVSTGYAEDNGWFAVMELARAIEIKGTIWEKRDAGMDYGVHLLEWKDR